MTFRFAWELTEIRRKLINHLLNYFLVSHLVILQTCVLFNSNCELKPTINQNSPKLVTLLYIFCHPLARRLLRTGACSPVSRRGILVVQRHTRRPRKTRRRPAFYMALARGAKRPLLEHVAQGQLWRQRNTRSYTCTRARTNARSLARSLARSHACTFICREPRPQHPTRSCRFVRFVPKLFSPPQILLVNLERIFSRQEVVSSSWSWR